MTHIHFLCYFMYGCVLLCYTFEMYVFYHLLPHVYSK